MPLVARPYNLERCMQCTGRSPFQVEIQEELRPNLTGTTGEPGSGQVNFPAGSHPRPQDRFRCREIQCVCVCVSARVGILQIYLSQQVCQLVLDVNFSFSFLKTSEKQKQKTNQKKWSCEVTLCHSWFFFSPTRLHTFQELCRLMCHFLDSPVPQCSAT